MKKGQRADCEDGSLFVDLDFPADDTALFSDSSTPISKLKGSITWLRPQVSCSSGKATENYFVCSIIVKLLHNVAKIMG